MLFISTQHTAMTANSNGKHTNNNNEKNYIIMKFYDYNGKYKIKSKRQQQILLIRK